MSKKRITHYPLRFFWLFLTILGSNFPALHLMPVAQAQNSGCATLSFSQLPNFLTAHDGQVVAGDFNGDGRPDAAATTVNPNQMVVAFNNGTEGDQTSTFINLSASPRAIATGRLNADNLSDIIIANPNGLVVFLGSSTGTFATPLNIALSFAARRVLVGDFNNDMTPDLAIVGSRLGEIRLGNNTGNFATVYASFMTDGSTQDMTAGDFNNDGRLDLIATQADGYSTILSDGPGEFTTTSRYELTPASVVSGDFNADGFLDVMTDGGQLLAGDNTGEFTVSTLSARPLGELVAADFNNDGRLDILSAGPFNGAFFLLSAPSSGYQFSGYLVGDTPYRSAVADFNGDGRLDVLVTPLDAPAKVLYNRGNNGFAAPRYYNLERDDNRIAAADFNGDGRLDLASSDFTGAAISLGTATGNLAPATAFPDAANAAGLVARDFNGDGRPDLAAVDRTSHTLAVMLNNGTGGLGAAVNYNTIDDPRNLAAGDFNLDGRLDLVTANQANGVVAVMLNNGTGGFGAATSFAVSGGPVGLAVGDFNRDNKPDIVAASSDTGAVSVLLNNFTSGAMPVFAAPAMYQVAPAGSGSSQGVTDVQVGDFNGDGRPDLASVFDRFDQGIFFSLNTGNGTFAAATSTSAQLGSHNLAVADFNNDGLDDVAAMESFSGKTLFVLGRTEGAFAVSLQLALKGGVEAGLATGDFDGNGSIDLVAASGLVVIVRNLCVPSAPALTLASFTVNASALTVCNTLRGLLTLSAPAPAGGVTISLSNSNANAVSLPTQITIPAGRRQASFVISATDNSTSQSVMLGASLNGGTALTRNVSVSPIGVQSLALSANQVTGGASVTGTVSLGCAVNRPVTITLSSSDTNLAAVPANVIVPTGATSTTFTINTTRPSRSRASMIRAKTSDEARMVGVKLTVVP